jgi:N-acetylglucosamine kinase-like BadF-type ATPase
MSDGRAPRGPLHGLVRERLALDDDLDLSGRFLDAQGRSEVAGFARLVHEAAMSGDAAARDVFERAATALAALVVAVRRALRVPDGVRLPVSWSGGVLAAGGFTLPALRARLTTAGGDFEPRVPVLSPVLGAVWLAAREAGTPLGDAAVARLAAADAASNTEVR